MAVVVIACSLPLNFLIKIVFKSRQSKVSQTQLLQKKLNYWVDIDITVLHQTYGSL